MGGKILARLCTKLAGFLPLKISELFTQDPILTGILIGSAARVIQFLHKAAQHHVLSHSTCNSQLTNTSLQVFCENGS